MLSFLYLIFCIAIGVLAEFDPTITAATDITDTVFTTTPLSPGDPDYVYEELNANKYDSTDNDNVNVTLEKRTPPTGIYACENPNWTGKCAWQALQENVCLDFSWNAGASLGVSWGPSDSVFPGDAFQVSSC